MQRLPGSDPSGPELFGSDWAALLERELGASETYRAAAASWKGSLAFVLLPDTAGRPEPGAERRALFLDLAHGSARAVRPALPGDIERASFRLEGPAAVWNGLLRGEIDPGAALMGGGLKLTRGTLFSLLPHLKAAKALFECARRVPTARSNGNS
jgi:putative sterol carrier protein